MNDKVTKLPTKPKVTWAVYSPGERMPTWIEATDFHVSEDHVLYLSNGVYKPNGGSVFDSTHLKNENVVAIFHHWDYVERIEERQSA